MNASERGRSNRRRGLDAERAVARYLRTVGFPQAERAVRTGFNAGGREVADPGDIAGVPGVVWQVKNTVREDIAGWMAETEQQRQGAQADLGVLVVRRAGKADPGRWWAWIYACDLAYLATTAAGGAKTGFPVRVELGHLVPLLIAAGYGTSEEAAA